jgi:hypothetical protein
MVALYAPYCEGFGKPQQLDQALEVLASGRFNGNRRLKPDGNHPYELSWLPVESPSEPSRCQLNFPEFETVSYQFSLPTAQLVFWLMEAFEQQVAPYTRSPIGQIPAPPQPALAPLAPGLPGHALPPPPLPLRLATPAPARDSCPLDLPDSFWCWLLVGGLPADRSA